MSSIALSEKDMRVIRITRLLDDPDLFRFIEHYFDSRINYENNLISSMIRKTINTNEQRDSLNFHIISKKINEEIKFGFKESLIEYMKLDDSDFTESSGA